MNHYIVVDKFSSEARQLRETFEKKYSTQKSSSSERFVWDYFFVENQYQFLRTPAYHYFRKSVYEKFHHQLVEWGRNILGCHDVSPPWLSNYVEGMQQKPHSDVPHGPWAWVFSLTPQKRKFTGGETFIFRPELLNYWGHFLDESDREQNAYMEFIPPDFNRLIVFDPRFPHGVTPVAGTQNPSEGRLVIHGWFVEPRPYVVGDLTTDQVQISIEPLIFGVSDLVQELGDFHGTLSFRLKVSKSGSVTSFQWLTDTVIGLQDHKKQKSLLNSWIQKKFSKAQFPKSKGSSQMTIPILFKA